MLISNQIKSFLEFIINIDQYTLLALIFINYQKDIAQDMIKKS